MFFSKGWMKGSGNKFINSRHLSIAGKRENVSKARFADGIF